MTSTLVLGIGNILMGDEGVGVHAVRQLESENLPEHVTCLDGGTGGLILLEPMQNADKVIIIDATLDGGAPGTVRRLQPRFSNDYPKALTAHDIGLKDMLDAFYLTKKVPEVVLFAVTVKDIDEVKLELSAEVEDVLPEIVKAVKKELAA
ncbi:MAG: hydrogenase maturation protease [Calditrichaeota bacterium]|nr:MAG: hydrogenase maturation protease [Calditrichota bacterium]